MNKKTIAVSDVIYIIGIIILTCLLFFLVTQVNASPVYTGTYMFTVSGNDNDVNNVEQLVNQWFSDRGMDDVDLNFSMKLEEGQFGLDGYGYSGTKSGTWFAPSLVDFYSVKGGNQYAMYWVNPALSSGLFTTSHLVNGGGKNPTLSHISFWTSERGYNETPELSTLTLFMLGLFAMTRYYNKK